MPTLRKSKLMEERFTGLAVGFLALVALAAVVTFLMSTSRVRVELTVAKTPITADVELTVAGAGGPSGAVPGRIVRVDGTTEVERQVGGAPASTGETLPPKRATGTVTLVNDRSEPQPLVATTRVKTAEGVIFRIPKAVRIPAKGRLADVPVAADLAGSQANIGPTKFSIPGLSPWLQRFVYAESTAPMSGGQGNPGDAAAAPSAARVTEADVEAARTEATENARADARKRAEEQAEQGERAFIVDETAQVTMIGAVGDARATILAQAVVTATAVIVDRVALEERARAALETAAASRDRSLTAFDAGAIEVRITTHDVASGVATLAVHATGSAVPTAQHRSFSPSRLTGFTAEEVATYLRSIPGVEDVAVRFSPFWVNRVPTTAGRVEIEVKNK